ncbi:MAG: DUF368 domain-containing protein [Myxococcota bacterium]|jgi:putative membrane protein|nr:DUF368 domain-containing protein [Myxococcota bacterium]
MRASIILALKGVCMGLADVVPGVSGGTMALILGIYSRLINAVKSVDFRIVKPFFRALRGGFRREARADLVETLRAMDVPWLLTLLLGIGSAFVVGSKVIPAAMERYPELMFAFFFGLVLASVSAPIRMMKRFGVIEGLMALAFTVGAFFLVGSSVEPPLDHKTVVAQDVADGGQTLKELAEAGPSALTPEGIYYAPENEALRAAVPVESGRGVDPKAKDNPYNKLVVPAGTQVHVPAPAMWFIFVAGFIAICAMVLPGISGSFLLLVMGSYYFMLNALGGFLKTLAHFALPERQALYVLLFVSGAALGLVLFSRLLSWLLAKHPELTMAALIGLMLGCLRVIWPFKARSASGELSNVLPDTSSFPVSTIALAIVASLLGIALVLGLTWLASRKRSDA